MNPQDSKAHRVTAVQGSLDRSVRGFSEMWLLLWINIMSLLVIAMSILLILATGKLRESRQQEPIQQPQAMRLLSFGMPKASFFDRLNNPASFSTDYLRLVERRDQHGGSSCPVEPRQMLRLESSWNEVIFSANIGMVSSDTANHDNRNPRK